MDGISAQPRLQTPGRFPSLSLDLQHTTVRRRSIFRTRWDSGTVNLCEKIAEYAFAVLNEKPNFHVNFIMNVSPNCDCWDINDQAIVPDIGIAASFDPVALDRACVDLVNQALPIQGSLVTDHGWKPGKDKFNTMFPNVHWEYCLDHAEEIGLGQQKYQLIEVK